MQITIRLEFCIAVLSDALDNWWEKKKEEWFN
jgi:hypothetical protein